MKEQRRKRGGVVRTAAAVSVGAAVGYALGILFAPASGQVTRRRLAMRVRNIRKTAARRIGKTQRVLAQRAENMREAATEWITDHIPHRTNGKARTLKHA